MKLADVLVNILSKADFLRGLLLLSASSFIDLVYHFNMTMRSGLTCKLFERCLRDEVHSQMKREKTRQVLCALFYK